MTLRPKGTGLFSAISGQGIQSGMNDSDIPEALLESHDKSKEPKKEGSTEKISAGWEELWYWIPVPISRSSCIIEPLNSIIIIFIQGDIG